MKRAAPAFAVFAALVIGVLLAACGGPSPQEPSGGAGAGSVTVVDALGRTVEFSELPRRIVVAGKSSLTVIDTLYLFPEARDRVVALVVGNQKPGDFLGFVDPAFGQKIALEMDAGPEEIAAQQPDAVILRSFMAESLGNALTQVDIPVVYVDLETPEQYYRDVAALGQLLGNGARAEEIRSFYLARLEDLARRLQGLREEEKPRALILQYSDQGGEVAFSVPSATWLQTIEVELAGGKPVWKDAASGGGWAVVNLEQIAAWNPDKIFVIYYKGDSAHIAGQLKADPQWQGLKAVQGHEIYGFAADILSWDQPDPRWILGVTWLASKLHPDRLPDLDIMQEMRVFFGQMYGLGQDSIEEHILPSLKGHLP